MTPADTVSVLGERADKQDKKERLEEEVEILEGEIIAADFSRRLQQRMLGGREQRTVDASASDPQLRGNRAGRPVYIRLLPTDENERRELLERIREERKARAARARAWANARCLS